MTSTDLKVLDIKVQVNEAGVNKHGIPYNALTSLKPSGHFTGAVEFFYQRHIITIDLGKTDSKDELVEKVDSIDREELKQIINKL